MKSPLIILVTQEHKLVKYSVFERGERGYTNNNNNNNNNNTKK